MENQIYTDHRFKAAFYDQSPCGIAVLHKSGRFLSANAALCEITNFTESELKTKTIQQLLHPSDSAGYHSQNRLLARDESRSGVFLCARLLRKSGDTVWAEMLSASVWDEGSLTYLVLHVLPLPNSGYKVEESNGNISVRPSPDWFTVATSNPKQTLGILGLIFMAMKYVTIADLTTLIGLFK